MDEKSKTEKEKKRFSKKKIISNKTAGANVKIVRKALKIPTNYDAYAVKQMQNYKNSKAQEMFKERNKKYTCIEEGFQQQKDVEVESGRLSDTVKSSISMDFLDASTREMIMNYEKRNLDQQQPSTSFSPSFTGSSSGGYVSSIGGYVYVEGSRPEKNLERLSSPMPVLTPMFDPSIPPPPIPMMHCVVNRFPTNQLPAPQNSAQNAQQSSTSIIIENEKDIKRETLDTEMPDVVIPTFQNPPTKDLQSLTKTGAEFQEDEDKKRKQALLWGLCQEELTVTSAIESANKRIENIRQKIERKQMALAQEEKGLDKLIAKRAELKERRICLLKSVEDGN